MGILDGLKVRRLIRELENPDPKIRMQAAEELGNMEGTDVIEPLIQVLLKPDKVEIVHMKVIQSLGKLKDPRAIVPLLKILYGRLDTVSFSIIVRVRAAEALGEIGDPRSIKPILQLLKARAGKEEESEGELSSRLRGVLVVIGRRHIGPLLDALKDSSDSIRVEAARTLKEIGDPQAVPYFIEALNDLNYNVRITAAEALGVIGDESTTMALMQSLKDVNRDVRRAVKDALDAVQHRGRRAKK